MIKKGNNLSYPIGASNIKLKYDMIYLSYPPPYHDHQTGPQDITKTTKDVKVRNIGLSTFPKFIGCFV
jgi:hypothetical protein